MKRRDLLVQFTVVVLATLGVLLYMSRQASEEMPRMRSPDVDGLIHAYLASHAGSDRNKARDEIKALGQPGVSRLRRIALDPARSSDERCLAIELLTSNPQATFDLLSLIDDPETDVRREARRVARYCITDLPFPRDPYSETEAAALRRWRDANVSRGMSAHSFYRGRPAAAPPADTSLTPTQIFHAWTRDGSLHTRSPYLDDLRAHGDRSVRELIVLTETDSSFQRSCALMILGMLKNSRATRFLEAELTRARSASDSAVLKLAIAQAAGT